MTKKKISSGSDWHRRLADTINLSSRGDVIVVDTEARKELAQRAIVRMKREGVLVEVGEANNG